MDELVVGWEAELKELEAAVQRQSGRVVGLSGKTAVVLDFLNLPNMNTFKFWAIPVEPPSVAGTLVIQIRAPLASSLIKSPLTFG